MADDDRYISNSQQRLLGMVMALAGHEAEGLAAGQIAKLAGCSPSDVTRDMANLEKAGWAEKTPDTGRWRLGPAPVRLARNHMAGMDRLQRRVDELRSRFGASIT